MNHLEAKQEIARSLAHRCRQYALRIQEMARLINESNDETLLDRKSRENVLGELRNDLSQLESIFNALSFIQDSL